MKNRKGFTLIELLIVLVILGILISLIVKGGGCAKTGPITINLPAGMQCDQATYEWPRVVCRISRKSNDEAPKTYRLIRYSSSGEQTELAVINEHGNMLEK